MATMIMIGDDGMLERMNETIYLSCVFSRDGKNNAYIERRLSAGNSLNGGLGKLLDALYLSHTYVSNAVLIPTLLPICGSET